MRRLFVLELNEVPLRILRWFADSHPESAIARLLAESDVGQSLADEPLPRELYPSQSWASLAMGVPFTDHGVFWYGDPKPAEYPLYWQAAAAAGVSTGLVGTLHSSPLKVQCADESIVFAIPDAFAADAMTIPERLSALQEFNLDLIQSNSRVVTDRSPLKKYWNGLTSLGRAGLGPAAGRELGFLALEVGRGQVPKERLRVGQFHLMADQFSRLAKRRDPDLAVLFSNHVASAMHRYWPASFPEDWDEEIYDPVWRERNEHEIPYALKALDLWLDRWMRWCEATDRTLCVLSSMGQRGGAEVDTSQQQALVVDDAVRFGEMLGIEGSFTVGRAMVPQVSYQFETTADAERNEAGLRDRFGGTDGLHIDRAEKTVTVTYSRVTVEADKLRIADRWFSLEEAGCSSHEVNEHRAGVHDPLGSIVVFNSDSAEVPDSPVNYLDIAPAILEHLGVERLPHHRESVLRL